MKHSKLYQICLICVIKLYMKQNSFCFQKGDGDGGINSIKIIICTT